MLRLGASAAGLGAILALACIAPASAAEDCAWEVRLPEASTSQGHRVTLIFTSFTGQMVEVRVGEQPPLAQTLMTTEWSVAYSGSIQCRLEGPSHISLTVDGHTTGLGLDIDGPVQIYVNYYRSGDLDFALWETDSDAFLLD